MGLGSLQEETTPPLSRSNAIGHERTQQGSSLLTVCVPGREAVQPESGASTASVLGYGLCKAQVSQVWGPGARRPPSAPQEAG
jgi:hypothetical protein